MKRQLSYRQVQKQLISKADGVRLDLGHSSDYSIRVRLGRSQRKWAVGWAEEGPFQGLSTNALVISVDPDIETDRLTADGLWEFLDAEGTRGGNKAARPLWFHEKGRHYKVVGLARFKKTITIQTEEAVVSTEPNESENPHEQS